MLPNTRIALAVSGGLDSVVMLDAVCKARLLDRAGQAKQAKSKNKSPEITVFHIHHGLQKQADEWLVFCEQLAQKYKVAFDFRFLHLPKNGNVEAQARAGRYEALAELCAEHGIEDLLLAHHQNDQAETVLLQLMRGAGVAGLSGMPQQRHLKVNGEINVKINGNAVDSMNAISLWRPLLNLSRAELEAYAKAHQLKWIEDPSNQDPRYRRNAIRKTILPKLIQIQPEVVANLARSASHLGDAQKLLDRLALLDGKSILKGMTPKGMTPKAITPKAITLKLSPLLKLAHQDPTAANNLLRYWLKLNDLAMPSQERLDSWWQDLKTVKADAHLEWLHDDASIRLWRGILQVAQASESNPVGRWIFKPVPPRSKQLGLPASWITEAQSQGCITSKARQGSEKIQIGPQSPRKTLKNLFQEADVPPWERQAPLLYIDAQLIAVAGVGVSYPQLVATGKRVMPHWVSS